jgi:hypothetical protein
LFLVSLRIAKSFSSARRPIYFKIPPHAVSRGNAGAGNPPANRQRGVARGGCAEFPPLANGAFIALAGLLGAALCQFIRVPLKRLAVVFILAAGILFAAFLGFDFAGVFPRIVSRMLVLFAIGISALVYDFISERLERMKLKHTMGLYFAARAGSRVV